MEDTLLLHVIPQFLKSMRAGHPSLVTLLPTAAQLPLAQVWERSVPYSQAASRGPETAGGTRRRVLPGTASGNWYMAFGVPKCEFIDIYVIARLLDWSNSWGGSSEQWGAWQWQWHTSSRLAGWSGVFRKMAGRWPGLLLLLVLVSGCQGFLADWLASGRRQDKVKPFPDLCHFWCINLLPKACHVSTTQKVLTSKSNMF